MSSQPSPAPPKPTLPPFWKWLMRITFAVTMVLFLAPAVYVVKYYAVDRPREEAIAGQTVSVVRDEPGDKSRSVAKGLPYGKRRRSQHRFPARGYR